MAWSVFITLIPASWVTHSKIRKLHKSCLWLASCGDHNPQALRLPTYSWQELRMEPSSIGMPLLASVYTLLWKMRKIIFTRWISPAMALYSRLPEEISKLESMMRQPSLWHSLWRVLRSSQGIQTAFFALSSTLPTKTRSYPVAGTTQFKYTIQDTAAPSPVSMDLIFAAIVSKFATTVSQWWQGAIGWTTWSRFGTWEWIKEREQSHGKVLAPRRKCSTRRMMMMKNKSQIDPFQP